MPFEKVILREPEGRRRTSFLTAAGLHALALAGLILSSLLAVEAVTEDVRADLTFSFFQVPDPPPVEPPPERPKPQIERARVEPQRPRVELKTQKIEEVRFQPMPAPEVEIPEAREQEQKMRLAADRLERIGGVLQAPEPDVKARASRPSTPALSPANLRGGAAGALAKTTLDAPEVVIPGGGRGGPGLPAREPGMQIQAGGSGSSIKAYASASGPTGVDFAIPAPSATRGARGGTGKGAPGLLTVPGGGVGGGAGSGGSGILKHGAASAPGGEIGGFAVGGGASKGGGGTRLESVRSALSSRYGLPLVSVNDLGQRSTDAARWNMLIPQISDLLRKVLARPLARGAQGTIASVQSDGGSLVIRYTDGIVHVLVPTDDGLAALFVARGSGARAVVSKVQEAESALEALARLGRGAS